MSAEPNSHDVTICFSGVKRHRSFAFLPRVGDRINITDRDLNETYSLDVTSVWFDDDYGHADTMATFINCDLVETRPYS